jgi:hypothetical protein
MPLALFSALTKGSECSAGAQIRNWALIKLHGSVDWGRPIVNSPQGIESNDRYLAKTFAALGERIEFQRGRITLRPEPALIDRRAGGGAYMTLYYPALSAPLGSEDELVCPEEHQNYLRQRLGAFDGLNVLVIGYSGLDREVMRFFAESGNSLRSLFIANGTHEQGMRAASKITEHIRTSTSVPQILPGGFTTLVQEGSHLTDYLIRVE